MPDRLRERADLLDYVERFSEILIASGVQRMSARVFSYILADDAASYTAAELADGLDVSLAAISGAVRELTTMGLLFKGRRPGTRADVYQLNEDDIWGSIILERSPLIERYKSLALEGMDTLPPGPGRDRLEQTAEFMQFWLDEVQGMGERWTARLRARRAAQDHGDGSEA
ncbi:MarR family transcriptional regulator [Glycomyces sp. L485]|uniref:GbsR/MarR family transcriptional regulator n=1 Tax=Glycomyces sp. L485 TaxID=2909235 RepID=UPI001F4A2BD2|nr:MarR family transcriptional regulator [Glycomyces sp. L485]MCH7232223.1 MarR family transcriptional regulator [Glycomyces sp. L485]